MTVVAHLGSAGSIFWTQRAWISTPCMTGDWEVGFQRHTGGKAVSRRHQFAEWNGDLRNVFWLYADDVCAIDLNVVRAKYWSSRLPPPGTTLTHEREDPFAAGTHKVYQC